MLVESAKIKLECLNSTRDKGTFGIIKDDLYALLKVFEKEFNFKKVVELSLTLCGKKKIRSLNKNYRKKDKATDVLSFPVHKSLRKKIYPDFLILGDIFICRDVAKKQAREFNITEREELVHLFTHGFLHLLGYDHEISPKEEKIMFGLEKKLISKIGKKKWMNR